MCLALAWQRFLATSLLTNITLDHLVGGRSTLYIHQVILGNQAVRSGIVILVFLAVSSTVGSAQDLPPGPGFDVVSRACTVCHELDIITAQLHDAEGWRLIADTMIKNGASLTPQEEDEVVDYLAKSLPQ